MSFFIRMSVIRFQIFFLLLSPSAWAAKTHPSAVTLFSGAGIIDRAVLQSGFDIKASFDIDPNRVLISKYNNFRRIRSIDQTHELRVHEFDLIKKSNFKNIVAIINKSIDNSDDDGILDLLHASIPGNLMNNKIQSGYKTVLDVIASVKPRFAIVEFGQYVDDKDPGSPIKDDYNYSVKRFNLEDFAIPTSAKRKVAIFVRKTERNNTPDIQIESKKITIRDAFNEFRAGKSAWFPDSDQRNWWEVENNEVLGISSHRALETSLVDAGIDFLPSLAQGMAIQDLINTYVKDEKKMPKSLAIWAANTHSKRFLGLRASLDGLIPVMSQKSFSWGWVVHPLFDRGFTFLELGLLHTLQDLGGFDLSAGGEIKLKSSQLVTYLADSTPPRFLMRILHAVRSRMEEFRDAPSIALDLTDLPDSFTSSLGKPTVPVFPKSKINSNRDYLKEFETLQNTVNQRYQALKSCAKQLDQIEITYTSLFPTFLSDFYDRIHIKSERIGKPKPISNQFTMQKLEFLEKRSKNLDFLARWCDLGIKVKIGKTLIQNEQGFIDSIREPIEALLSLKLYQNSITRVIQTPTLAKILEESLAQLGIEDLTQPIPTAELRFEKSNPQKIAGNKRSSSSSSSSSNSPDPVANFSQPSEFTAIFSSDTDDDSATSLDLDGEGSARFGGNHAADDVQNDFGSAAFESAQAGPVEDRTITTEKARETIPELPPQIASEKAPDNIPRSILENVPENKNASFDNPLETLASYFSLLEMRTPSGVYMIEGDAREKLRAKIEETLQFMEKQRD